MYKLPEDVVATLNDAEIDTLRRVFEAICIEYGISRKGSQSEHLARFLMAAYCPPMSTEQSLLTEARCFYQGTSN